MKAVVFVDVQNDFVRGGALPFGYPLEDNLPKIIDFAKKCVNDPDCKIYATRDTHEKSDSLPESADGTIPEKHVGYLSTLEGKKLPIEHCIEGTDGWNVVDSLMDVIHTHCTFVNKPTFGSFDLCEIIDEDIKRNNCKINEIVVLGYCTSICVLSNAVLLRAKFPDMKISVMKDLCGCVSEESHRAALKALEMQQIDVI